MKQSFQLNHMVQLIIRSKFREKITLFALILCQLYVIKKGDGLGTKALFVTSNIKLSETLYKIKIIVSFLERSKYTKFTIIIHVETLNHDRNVSCWNYYIDVKDTVCQVDLKEKAIFSDSLLQCCFHLDYSIKPGVWLQESESVSTLFQFAVL